MLPRYLRKPFWRFISNPDEEVSLKLFFDNFRNYTTAGALLIGGVYLSRGSDSSAWSCAAAWFLLGIGGLFVGMSALQLFALCLRMLHSVLNITATDHINASSFSSRLKMLVLLIVPVGLLFSVTWFVYVLVTREVVR